MVGAVLGRTRSGGVANSVRVRLQHKFVSSRLIMDLAASQQHKDKFIESRLADWAAACFESELKNTDHLLQKLLRFKPLARRQ
jgi:hypothetical protein